MVCAPHAPVLLGLKHVKGLRKRGGARLQGEGLGLEGTRCILVGPNCHRSTPCLLGCGLAWSGLGASDGNGWMRRANSIWDAGPPSLFFMRDTEAREGKVVGPGESPVQLHTLLPHTHSCPVLPW